MPDELSEPFRTIFFGIFVIFDLEIQRGSGFGFKILGLVPELNFEYINMEFIPKI